MTVILPENVTCPECGREHPVHVLAPGTNLAGDEPFVYRGYTRCPWCGDEQQREGAVERLSDDAVERELQLLGIHPAPEREQRRDGTTTVTLGKWIRPKKPG